MKEGLEGSVRFNMMSPNLRATWPTDRGATWLAASSLREQALMLQSLGFDGIEFAPRSWLTARATTLELAPSFFRKELEGIALEISAVGGSLGLEHPERRAQAIQDNRKFLEIAKALGLAEIGEHYTPEAETLGPRDHLLIDSLKQLAPDMERMGVGMVMEPISHVPCQRMDLLKHGTEVLNAVGSPHIKLVADVNHMLRESNDIPASFARWGKLIGAVHFPGERLIPQIGSVWQDREPDPVLFDYRPAMRVLKELGYSGWLTLECCYFHPNPEEPLGRALAYVKQQWNEA